MGSCCSKSSLSTAPSTASSGGQQFQTLNARKDVDKREKQWQATGQIVLRDANLKTGDKLQVLPDSIGQVGQNAKVLDAKNNRLTILPSSLSLLTSLHRVVLSGNQLSSLSGITALSALKVLLVDNNKLTELPADIGRLSRLETLVSSGNMIVALPSEIGQLTALKTLSCNSNKITSLPSTLGYCGQLVELDASDNALKEVPKEISQLSNLTSLNVEDNLIHTIPSAVLRRCQALHTIKLRNNPITIEVFQGLDGYSEFEQRRQNKVSKQMAGGAAKNLDEGISRKLAVH